MIKFTPILSAAFAALFYFGLVDNARGPTYPDFLRAFEISPSAGSLIYALSSFAGLVVIMATKYWLPYVHLRKSFIISSLLLSSSSFMLYFAHLIDNFLLALLSSIVLGVGVGFCSVSMNLAVESQSPVHLRRQTFAALHTTYGVSSLLSPLLYSFLISLGLKVWSQYYLILGFIALFLLFLPGKKDDVYIKSDEEKNEGEVNNKKIPLPLLLVISLCVGTYVASEIVVSSRLVFFLEEVHQFKKIMANNALSLFFFFLTAGRLSLAVYSWKISSQKLMLGSLILTIILSLLGLYKYPYAFSFTGLTMSIFFPSIMDWLGQTFPKDITRVTSFALTGISAHLVLMHLGFGKLVTELGLEKAMFLTIGLSICSLVMLFILLAWNQFHQKEIL
jgi:fucose permease